MGGDSDEFRLLPATLTLMLGATAALFEALGATSTTDTVSAGIVCGGGLAASVWAHRFPGGRAGGSVCEQREPGLRHDTRR